MNPHRSSARSGRDASAQAAAHDRRARRPRHRRTSWASAVAAAGGTLISSRPRQVFQQPTPRRDRVVRTPRSAGRPIGHATETLAACTGDLPDGTLVVDSGERPDRRVAVPPRPRPARSRRAHTTKRPSHDCLPNSGSAAARSDSSVRAYRPRRRAVIEATGAQGRLFVKVVRPRSRRAAARPSPPAGRQRACPAPHSLGWTDDGLLVLQALPGRTLREAIRAGDDPRPSGESILTLLDRLPAALAARSATLVVARPCRALRRHRRRDRARPRRIGRTGSPTRSAPKPASVRPSPSTATSTRARLLVDGTTISGLLDIDGARPGDRLDDLGCLLGHLSVLAQIDRRHAARDQRASAPATSPPSNTPSTPPTSATAPRPSSSPSSPDPTASNDPHWPATTRRLVDLADRWLASARKAAGAR